MTPEDPTSSTTEAARLPRAEVASSSRWLTWAWLAPLAAIVLGGALVFQAARERGEIIEIRFQDAAGLRAGDPLVYRGIQVGAIREVKLGEGLDSVDVEVEIRRDAVRLAREGARFWIVRPEVSLQRVAGLETLLGPRYIEVMPGIEPDAPFTRKFEGLASAPTAGTAEAGNLELVIKAQRRGSLSVGSPVLYRDTIVGTVESMQLAPNAQRVDVHINIFPRFATLVRDNSRFWNASGFGVDLGLFGGLSVRAESIESLLTGGIGFATPTRPGDPVQHGHIFDLASEPKGDWLAWEPEIPIAPPPE